MSIRKDVRQNPRAWVGFGLYNYGNPLGVYCTRKTAVEQAEQINGLPWSEIRGHMEIHKVRVETFRP